MLFRSIIALNGSAQKKKNIYYFKDNGIEVKTQDSADFIRIISEPDSGSVFFEYIEYFKNGNKKRLGYVSSFEPYLVYEGTLLTYYQNGNKQSVQEYKQGKLSTSNQYYFYFNGKLNEIRQEIEISNNDVGYLSQYKLIQKADTSGRTLLDSLGNGFVDIVKPNEDKEEGKYLQGFKDGTWKEYIKANKTNYEERYERGKFISGVYLTDDGETKEYAIQESLPSFKGGINGFNQYLSKNLSYPMDAMSAKAEGQVFLNFVIERDGSLVDIKIVKSVFPSLDEEAVRVLKKSPKWNAGIQRGKAVRVSYAIPIMFKLP